MNILFFYLLYEKENSADWAKATIITLCGLTVDRMSEVHLVAQHIRNTTRRPVKTVWVVGFDGDSTVFIVAIRRRSEYFLSPQPVSYVRRTDSRSAELKDSFDYRRGFGIDNQLAVLPVFQISVWRMRTNHRTACRLDSDDIANFLAGVSRKPLVEVVFYRRDLVAEIVAVLRVKTVIDCDIPHVVARKYHLGVVADLYVISTEAR